MGSMCDAGHIYTVMQITDMLLFSSFVALRFSGVVCKCLLLIWFCCLCWGRFGVCL